MRALVVTGLVLVLAAQVWFAATGAERAFPYVPVQILSAAGTAILVFGAATATPLGVAIGFGVNALGRLLQLALGLSRLGVFLNLALLAGWAWATVAAARGRSLRGAAWALAIAHAASLVYVLGRFEPMVGLGLATTGLLLAAPNMEKR